MASSDSAIFMLSSFCSTIRFVLRLALILLASCFLLAQGPQDTAKKSDQTPPVKVNILNVCTPTADDQKELKAALGRLPKTVSFATDYEISRGVATTEEGKTAKYVRLRRDLKSDSPLVTIQYSLSLDPESTIETLVFRGRDVKDLLALSIEDSLSTSVSKPATVIQSDTPASRIRDERVGKTTLALTRCENVDQSQYEPIFAQASAVLADYRRILKLRTMLASDIAWLDSASGSSSSSTQKSSASPAKSATSSSNHDTPR
jgi:hypothetical protein